MIEKLRLEIPLVLPGVTSSADACVDRLREHAAAAVLDDDGGSGSVGYASNHL